MNSKSNGIGLVRCENREGGREGEEVGNRNPKDWGQRERPISDGVWGLAARRMLGSKAAEPIRRRRVGLQMIRARLQCMGREL